MSVELGPWVEAYWLCKQGYGRSRATWRNRHGLAQAGSKLACPIGRRVKRVKEAARRQWQDFKARPEPRRTALAAFALAYVAMGVVGFAGSGVPDTVGVPVGLVFLVTLAFVSLLVGKTMIGGKRPPRAG